MDFRLPNLGEGIDAATVEAVLVKPGDKVPVGGAVFRFRAAAATPTPKSGERKAPAAGLLPTASPSRPPEPVAGVKTEFKLPSLGEGIDTATVTAVLVKPGDVVKVGQAVVSVETDKAAMEIESESAGTVAQVHIKPGDKTPIGTLLLTLIGGAVPKAAPPPPTPVA